MEKLSTYTFLKQKACHNYLIDFQLLFIRGLVNKCVKFDICCVKNKHLSGMAHKEVKLKGSDLFLSITPREYGERRG